MVGHSEKSSAVWWVHWWAERLDETMAGTMAEKKAPQTVLWTASRRAERWGKSKGRLTVVHWAAKMAALMVMLKVANLAGCWVCQMAAHWAPSLAGSLELTSVAEMAPQKVAMMVARKETLKGV